MIKPRLCITTYFNSHFERIGKICTKSIKKYAIRHGYDTRICTETRSDLPPQWEKIGVILSLFDEGYEFVLWVDADALFVRFDVDIADEIENEKDIYVPLFTVEGKKIPNTGVMLLRNAPATRHMLESLRALKQYTYHIWYENAAFFEYVGIISYLPPTYRLLMPSNGIVSSNPHIDNRIKWLSSRWNEIPGYDARSAATLIRHYAGHPTHTRLYFMSISAYGADLIPLRTLLKNCQHAFFGYASDVTRKIKPFGRLLNETAVAIKERIWKK